MVQNSLFVSATVLYGNPGYLTFYRFIQLPVNKIANMESFVDSLDGSGNGN